MIFRSPVESGQLLPLTDREVALDFSDKMGIDFPSVTLEEDTDGPVSNVHGTNGGLLNIFDEALPSGPGDHYNKSMSLGLIFSIS